MRNEDIGTDNGSAIIEPGDPVAANSPGWWTITYTAGPRGIDVGGSVRFEIPYGFTPPQPHWHGDIGHVSATCSREGVELKITVEEPPVRRDPESFYYVTRWGRHLFVQVLGEPLVEGDTITLVYGRHPGFQAGAFAQHFAGPAEFTVATDVDGTRSAKFSGYTLIAEQPVLEVVAAEPDHFEVYAPTLAVTGEPIELTLRQEMPDVSTVRDGVLTPDDTPIAGVVLTLGDASGLPLLDASGQPITAVTDQNGYYEFTGLEPGLYTILEDHPATYTDSIDTPGTLGGVAVNEHEPVELVAQLMDWNNVRYVLVEDDENRLVGQVSQRALLRLIGTYHPDRRDSPMPVSEVMQRSPVTVTPETSTLETIALMRRHRMSCLPVVKNGQLIGRVTESQFMTMARQLLVEKLETR